ncbi:chromate transporter [Enterocloster sp.]|uniref:chromate transporter n=1 Tax=Enterocloster sp. TaxID=2719315 RepID=UPI003AF74076
MIYLQLFLSFLQIGAFSFGGGYAAMPLIQNQVVQLHPWLSQSEFTDLITISQMTPGPIAVNSATFVGTRIAGVPGALAATIGCVLPSCILVTILAKIYLKYRSLSLLQDILKSLRPAVIAMIAAAGVSILVTAFWGNDISSLHLDTILSSTNIRAVGIFLLSLILLARFKMDPIHVMLLSGGAEVVMQLIMKLL